MRVLFWYCDRFDWTPAVKTLPEVPDAEPAENRHAVVAFVHIEPKDVQGGSTAETKPESFGSPRQISSNQFCFLFFRIRSGSKIRPFMAI